MDARLWQVDAFADRAFAGNPAAVCLLLAPADDAWMQRVAAEMNLSETAFLREEGRAWRLRWFTPETEVDLCGHATLASAHVLFERGAGAVRFLTRSGELAATRADGWIELDFPALPVTEAPAPPGLLEALGVSAVFSGVSRFDRLVEVASEEIVRGLRVDVERLRSVDARGVIVTSRGGACDFVSRCFYPRVGIAEDPVTGSAHCALAPYWAARLAKTEMTGHQVSARGGVVRVRLEGSDRVALGGRAVTVFRGELCV
ncbi:MAG: PhzF family phenazine biosynthesis protein [Planctomycetota bacterium]|jgi:predicted PhzF superfamily epimerase YddE/YHI9